MNWKTQSCLAQLIFECRKDFFYLEFEIPRFYFFMSLNQLICSCATYCLVTCFSSRLSDHSLFCPYFLSLFCCTFLILLFNSLINLFLTFFLEILDFSKSIFLLFFKFSQEVSLLFELLKLYVELLNYFYNFHIKVLLISFLKI